MCKCIDEVNALLEPKNTRLSVAIMFGEGRSSSLLIETEAIKKQRGAQKPTAVFPSFCPFCGEKYPE